MTTRNISQPDPEWAEEVDDTEYGARIVPDGGRVRVPMQFMDSLQKDVAKHTPAATDPARHRPGFRDSRDSAALDALEQAYRDYDQADADAWRTNDDHPINTQPGVGLSPGRKEGQSCSIDGQRGRLQLVNDKLECVVGSRDAHTDDRAAAYAEYDQQQQNAWRG